MNMATSSLRQMILAMCSTGDGMPLNPCGQEPAVLLAQMVGVGEME